MTQSLQEHLESAYDVDIEQEITNHQVMMSGGEVADRFIVDNEDKANWCLRKLARIEAARNAAREQARIEQERIAAWLEAELRRHERSAAWLETNLEQYHRNQLTADPKRKTIELPAGTLKARKAPDSVEILVDEETFLDWALDERPDFVRVSRVIDRKALREAAIKDGESIPNVYVQQGQVRYSVEVSS